LRGRRDLVTSSFKEIDPREEFMGRVALVTGGSRGIGEAISKALKAAGYTVAANYAGNDEKAAAFTEATGIPTYKWNVADYDGLEGGHRQGRGRPRPDRGRGGECRDHARRLLPQDDARTVEGGRGHEPHRRLQHRPPGLGRHARPRLRAGHRDQSINGQKGQAGQVNYAATKAGDLGIVKSLAQEGAAKGITANAICPGYIGTEMVRAIPEKVLNERIIPQIPAGRLGEPEEIARCVVFLASDDSGFINGSTISANGAQFFV
jgi:acetoacetyl-CoA reductase